MLVGNSGCGKSAIFRELFSMYENETDAVDVDNLMQMQSADSKRGKKLISGRPRTIAVQTTYFNYYTTSEIFQKILERPLEKKSGRCFAPSGVNRHLIYFINDLNMPEVDLYGTVQPHTIIRQFMDYRQWWVYQ